MNVSAKLLALPLLALAACVTDSNRCVAGYDFAPAYDTCLQADGGSDAPPAARDAGDDTGEDASARQATSRVEAGRSETGAEAAAPADASDAGTGLGAVCDASADCPSTASYCLKSPLAPTDPGICTITQCTAAKCTSAYACCDCSASSISSLQAFPPGVCIPDDSEAQLTALGCACK